MRTTSINIYKYSELDPAAQEKAREWYRRLQDGDTFWSEFCVEEFVQQAEHMGFHIPKREGRGYSVYWSGFWSQGDGACFEGSWSARDCHPEKVADGWGDDPATTEIKRIAGELGEIAKKFPCSSFTIKHYGRYSHERCTEFDFDSGASMLDAQQLDTWKSDGYDGEITDEMLDIWADRCADDFEGAEDHIKETARDLMRWLYRQIEKEYAWFTSDEKIVEDIEASDYEFTEDGKVYTS